MELTMNEILNKYNDCDMFSLTGRISKYTGEDCEKNNVKREKYIITEDEFLEALNDIKEKDKIRLNKIYNSHKDELNGYPDFNDLYTDIEKECYDFNSKKSRDNYLKEFFNEKRIIDLKKAGLDDEQISQMKKTFFHCSFIADKVGQITKYGSEHKAFFYNFYMTVAMNIDRENEKERFCCSNGKSPIEQIPDELKKHFLYYKISFYNSVTVSSGLMINYYFSLNDETKKYLLKFRNDFELTELEDLTLYKDNKVEFCSCTHEKFNSLQS